MKKLGILLAGVFAVTTVYAQDPAPEAAPAEAAPAEAPPADAAPVDSAAPATDAAVPDTSTPAEAPVAEAAAPTEETASAPAEATASDHKPWLLYAGYDRAHLTFRISNPNPASISAPSLQTRFGGTSFNSDFNVLRGGVRFFEFVGLEAHLGFKGSDGSDPGSVSVKKNIGIYAVPTGVLFDTVEIAAVLGYSRMDLERGSASETFNGVSYGLNTELPLRHFFQSLPDIRIGLGGIVYHQKNDARIYGTHFGIRYDFKI